MTEKKTKQKRKMVTTHSLPPEDREGNFKEVHLGYLHDFEVIEEANRCIQCVKPGCQIGCSAHCKIPDMMHYISEGQMNEATKLAYQFYAFPRALHRICPALCMDNCILKKKGESVNIFDVIRWLTDNHQRPTEWYDIPEDTGKKVAIIGSGPAGLTAAYYLRKKGHQITIYEKLNVPGGMLTVGIPEYRLKKDVLFAEISEIEKTGVKIVYNRSYGSDFNYKHLFNQGYDAVLIAHGAHAPKWMNIPGENLKGNMHAVDFLRKVALGNPPKLGKRVAVIGAGDTAFDAVRVAKRLGSEAFIVYRRTIDEMPATKSEIIAANEENIPLKQLTNPVQIIGDGLGGVKAIELITMELGEPDSSGRRRPIPVPGSEYTVEIDNVIQAVSQKPSVEEFDDVFDLDKWDCFKIDNPDFSNMTNVKGVFAAGDDVTGPLIAIIAIADAHNAVRGIHKYLTGEDLPPQPEFTRPVSKPPKRKSA